MKNPNTLLSFLLYIWQLPQNMLALLIITITKRKKLEIYRGINIYCWNIQGGISLGDYIFLPKEWLYSESTKAHEWGHTRQSRMFGPLYLLVIGIPSFFGNAVWDRLFHKNWPQKKHISGICPATLKNGQINLEE
ncbi:MAG: hypothetical protein LBM77_08795 [Spirochaetaceae bacterium]|jgi:hypothetical protein|nr:hypothetical protein [Spirochaetaceae bacterium]